jgi:hypothetical protein
MKTNATVNKTLTVVQTHAPTMHVIQIVLEMVPMLRAVTALSLQNACQAIALVEILVSHHAMQLSQQVRHTILIAIVRLMRIVAVDIVKLLQAPASHPASKLKLNHTNLDVIARLLVIVDLVCALVTSV